jgi:hypothetical protein
MRVSDLSPAGSARLRQVRVDMIVGKHEGPESWDGWRLQAGAQGCKVITLGGFDVLLPVPQTHHIAIALVRAPALSSDGRTLTLFLVDRTYGRDDFFAGRIAICFKLETLSIAADYHEIFLDATTNWEV